jgi:hypothetical protein
MSVYGMGSSSFFQCSQPTDASRFFFTGTDFVGHCRRPGVLVIGYGQVSRVANGGMTLSFSDGGYGYRSGG